MSPVTDESVDVILKWWQGLTNNRADRARLRHVGSLMEATLEPATMRLARQLGAQIEDLEEIALLASVLAHVRTDQPDLSVARALGTPEAQPAYSPLRLQRLIKASKGPEQLTAFRRALAVLKQTANVKDLSRSLLDWNNTSQSNRRRQQWLYDYYHTDNPARNQPKEASS